MPRAPTTEPELAAYTTAARTSEFIQKHELPVALARSDAGACTLIWVPLERNDLDPKYPLESRLSELECATRNKQKLYDFEPTQKGWMQVEDAILRAVKKRRMAEDRG